MPYQRKSNPWHSLPTLMRGDCQRLDDLGAYSKSLCLHHFELQIYQLTTKSLYHESPNPHPEQAFHFKPTA